MYSASKFTVKGLTQVVAKEIVQYIVIVVSYCHRIVGISMWDRFNENTMEHMGTKKDEAFDEFVEGITIGRTQTSEEVAHLA